MMKILLSFSFELYEIRGCAGSVLKIADIRRWAEQGFGFGRRQ